MITLVLLRHGQSTWNMENRFSGWTDVGLTEAGEAEARQAGEQMAADGYRFDVLHTSVLTRAIATAEIALGVMSLSWVPVARSWRLNERHYGGLQGLNKKETAEKYGEDQVFAWRRSYDVRPPALELDDERHPRHDARYQGLTADLIPDSECLKDVVERMLPYWHDAIVPHLLAGMSPLVAAHGNSLRALVKHLDGISDDEISAVNIPTGIPLVYRFNDALEPTEKFYLGDPAEAEAAAKKVADQASLR